MKDYGDAFWVADANWLNGRIPDRALDIYLKVTFLPRAVVWFFAVVMGVG